MNAPREKFSATVTREALLSDGDDRRFREFLHAFMVFSRRVEAVRDAFAEFIGVTGPQYELLSHLRQIGGNSATVSMLADRLHCSGAFVTTEIGKLVSFGLVTKHRDPGDQRRVMLSLTAAAHGRLRQLAPLQSVVNDELFAALTRDDLVRLQRLMPRMAADGDRAVARAELMARLNPTAPQRATI